MGFGENWKLANGPLWGLEFNPVEGWKGVTRPTGLKPAAPGLAARPRVYLWYAARCELALVLWDLRIADVAILPRRVSRC